MTISTVLVLFSDLIFSSSTSRRKGMRLFTIWIDGNEDVSHTVLDTSEDAVLIDDNKSLRWVPLEQAHVALIHRTPDEERWWGSITQHSH